MAENWEIEPGGTGDYTTLQAGETAKNGDITGRGVVTFECFDHVTDVGECTVDGWTNQDATNYVRIWAPLAERHDGTAASAGAWIDIDAGPAGLTINEEFTRVEGLRFNMDFGVFGTFAISVANVSDVLIDSNLCVGVSEEAGTTYIKVESLVAGMTGITVRNNIIYAASVAGFGISVIVDATPGNADMTIAIYNNTIDDAATAGISMVETDGGNEATLTVTLENNICTNNGTDFAATVVRGSVTGNNNCSEDDTADDWDGSGSIINQTPANLFVTEGADHTLKAGSNAIDAGKTQATFDWDALHVDGDTWRPQAFEWDIGALELFIVGTARWFEWEGDGAGVKTAWNDGRNWINAAGAAYAQAIWPGTGIVDTPNFITALGDTALSPVGYDVTTLGFKLKKFNVGELYDGELSTDGNPIIFEAEEVVIDGQSADGMYLEGAGDGLESVWVVASKTLLDLDGTVGDCELKKGKITLAAGVTIATLVLSYIDSKTRDAEVTIESGATLPAIVTAYGGKVSNSAAITTLDMTNGEWTNEEGADIVTAIIAGGTYYGDGGDITTLDCRGGLVDGSRTQRPRIWTTITVGHGSILDLNDGVGNITWVTLNTEGGSIIWPVGKVLNPA